MEENRNGQESAAPAISEVDLKPTVVGIGASAGGLAALKRLFALIPADSGLVFVVVIHLSPEHKSLLPELLQPNVKFPVQQVTETVPLEPNNVYVIPPNANLSAIDTHLRLSRLEEKRSERAPIDHFFRTLARTHDGHSVGVILTGTGSDGTLGLKEIKARGGLILVQDPNDAEFDGMPQSAIATGLVDRVLPIADIPEALLRLSETGRRISLPQDNEDLEPLGRILLPKLLAILKTRTERDFSRYKPATLLRRIARRMQLNYIEEFEQYQDLLRSQPDEARALADDLLITVTSFFRDAAVFTKLESEVVPHLFEGKGPDDALRIWSVGCATGEEAYSVAMLLLEEAARHEAPPKIQIFASDLHKRSLDRARDGLYPGDIETDVSAKRLKRFFQKVNGSYRICKEVRDTVVFAPHNLLGDPPFSRLDLITCRNLLIYLERSVQRDVIDLFHYALRPQGYLLLGSAETIDSSELFRHEHKKLCLYRKRNVPAPEPRLPVFPLTRVRWNGKPTAAHENTLETVPYEALHQMLIEQSALPSILVSPDNQLVHVSAAAGRYLVHPEGEITSSALRLVREELRIDLQALLQLAREKKAPLNSRPLPVRFNGHAAPVVVRVVPGREPEQDGFALVIFEEHQPQPDSVGSDRTRSDITLEPGRALARVAELESELEAGRQHLQTIIEEYETSREEMKVANEEMQSTNEELRSTLEELETSKEELQSINEELQTVNQENRHKVEELSQLSSDLQNLMAATDIATLFLDRDLRIMRFTPRLSDLFNIRLTDRGRSISDLTNRLGYRQLREDAEAVLSRLIPIQREIRDDRGHWYLTNVLPYRSTDDRIEGVVITFIDITSRKAGEAAVRESESRLRIASEAAGLGVFDWNPSNDSVSWENDRIFEIFGRTRQEGALNAAMFMAKVVHPDDAERFKTELEASLTSGQLQFTGRFHRGDGALRWVMFSGKVEFADNGAPSRMPGVAADVTERMTAELALRASEARYHALFAASPVPFMVLSPNAPDFTVTAANEAYLTATLTTRDSLIGRKLFDVLTDDPSRPGQLGSEALAISLDRVVALRRTDAMERVRYDIVTPGGQFEPHWWLAINAPLLDAFGNISSIIHQVTRVTELHLAEEAERRAQDALRKSEARFRTLADTAPALIWQNDVNGKNVFINRYFLDYTGLLTEEVGGEKWHALVHPDDAAAYLADYDAAVHEQRPFHNRNRIRRHDGAWRWFENYAQPLFNEHGHYGGHVGVSTDVNATIDAELLLRQSEQRQQLLIEGVPQLVWRAVDVGQWTWVSPQWTTYTGQSEQDSLRWGWLEMFHPDDRAAATEAWPHAIKTGAFEIECRIRRASDHDFRWFQNRATSVRNPAGDVIEWLGTSTDIHELRELQERQQVLVGELQHRTRNLMGVIRSLAEKSARSSSGLDDFSNRFLDRLDALARAQSLLSRLNEHDRVTFDELVTTELMALNGNTERVTLTGPSGIRLRSSTVQTLALAVHELATNALKYGALRQPSGLLEINWSVESTGDEDQPWLHIDWRETGVPMPTVDVSRRQGQGRELIERALPYQLKARTHYELGLNGVHCTISIPLSQTNDSAN